MLIDEFRLREATFATEAEYTLVYPVYLRSLRIELSGLSVSLLRYPIDRSTDV